MTAIAIDGPAGAGKSTIARRAAAALGYIYVDTGALYRAVGLAVLDRGADPFSEAQVCLLLNELRIDLAFEDGKQKVLLNGMDVSGRIRTEAVSMAASGVSAIPRVRTFLFALQKNLAEKNDVVMDGRDIGTIVLPDAEVKIFLTASAEERARRRHLELLEKGMESDYNTVLKDLKKRDYNDAHRAVAPLVPAQDAVVIDTTGKTLEQSARRLISVIRDRLRKPE